MIFGPRQGPQLGPVKPGGVDRGEQERVITSRGGENPNTVVIHHIPYA
jgi:hypothetical protein